MRKNTGISGTSGLGTRLPGPPGLGRRALLGATGTLALAVAAGNLSAGRAGAAERFQEDPFALGVASGDPWPDGVVLWTRLAPRPLTPDGSGGMSPRAVTVLWEVADDERFERVVSRGWARAVAELAHSVHVEVTGLAPGRTYFYRFQAGGVISPVGRTRTAPAPGSRPKSLSFAFASCQAWFEGFYTAYRHMAEEDLDLVLHLGDYIYENPIDAMGGVRNTPVAAELRGEPTTLAQYRNRHALHRYDADLIAAHQAHPFAVVWDDHEVEDNWAGDRSKHTDVDPAVFRVRAAAAFQAYYEHLPLRLPNKPRGFDTRMYRSLRYGRLASFHILDTRLFRDDQACGDGTRAGCAERLDPGRTILGAEQENWLYSGLGRSDTTWNLIPQQIAMNQVDTDPGPGQSFVMDFWDGYAASRQRLFDQIVARNVSNPVVLTGDMHRHLVADLKRDFDRPDSPTIGVEFIGTSISTKKDGVDLDPSGASLLAANEHIKFTNYQRGYVRCTATPEQCRADFRVLPYVTRPGAPVSTRVSFATEAGRPGVQPV
ncbi:alkaline phosphatase D family protein [Streptomyces paludis]|uniref:Alkaline phosphatase n=1 Tax=Streptomyces paludis TaxID=2282738 RepID=A0A345HIH5_9ACTN|nr:alkaline phosphatase D family protein [Streptomyces paludis]AXG76499.1 alkaline phosphatase [Streptomyces paludis]